MQLDAALLDGQRPIVFARESRIEINLA